MDDVEFWIWIGATLTCAGLQRAAAKTCPHPGITSRQKRISTLAAIATFAILSACGIWFYVNSVHATGGTLFWNPSEFLDIDGVNKQLVYLIKALQRVEGYLECGLILIVSLFIGFGVVRAEYIAAGLWNTTDSESRELCSGCSKCFESLILPLLIAAVFFAAYKLIAESLSLTGKMDKLEAARVLGLIVAYWLPFLALAIYLRIRWWRYVDVELSYRPDILRMHCTLVPAKDSGGLRKRSDREAIAEK